MRSAPPSTNVGVGVGEDRKSTRLNSSHLGISYAVFCLKKKKNDGRLRRQTEPARPCRRATSTRARGHAASEPWSRRCLRKCQGRVRASENLQRVASTRN